jgi:S-adenosylmethionine:tRNA ribosyltransferase-isomerase
MDIELFDYDLPRDLIAQHPSRKRDESRLMVIDRRRSGLAKILPFSRIIDYLQPGDALVVNNTKVFKARLFAKRASGAGVEVFLVRRVPDAVEERWLALVSPSRRVKPGEWVEFEGTPGIELLDYQGDGRWYVRFTSRSARERLIARYGHVPLPHYIRREDSAQDIRRYQTVFADSSKVGAVAAPTAGFHFTRRLLDQLDARGIVRIELTLHVGPGTFKPVTAERVEDHSVDPEFAELPVAAADAINRVRDRGGKLFVVGTTSVRTLESARIVDERVQPLSKMVDLYIRPGHRFQVVDHMVTNFHLPRSSLLILVSAFAGRERMLAAYEQAISECLRFYSYGDAMLIL